MAREQRSGVFEGFDSDHRLRSGERGHGICSGKRRKRQLVILAVALGILALLGTVAYQFARTEKGKIRQKRERKRKKRNGI